MKRFILVAVLMSLMGLGLSSRHALASDTDYRIGEGDVLRITVYDHPDLTTVARVGTDGNILFPLAGTIKIGNMTTSAASQVIANKLNGEYVVNPQVSIFVEEFRSKKVVIIGEVVKPGLYELSGPTSLLELISKAGGLTKSAGQEAAIRRAKGDDGLPAGDDIKVNILELLESGLEAVDINLQDGDMVTIPKAGTVYVTGMVNRPAAYSLEPGMTVIKAITMAGGFSPLAAQSKVKIIRKINGKEQVMERVSLYEQLRPDDVMVVPESFF